MRALCVTVMQSLRKEVASMKRTSSKILPVAALVILIAAGPGSGGAVRTQSPATANPWVYQLVVTYREQGAPHTQLEWVSPSTGEWRVKNGNRIKIYSQGRYAIYDPLAGTYVRVGSQRFIGYLADQAVSASALRTYLAGRALAGSSREDAIGATTAQSGTTVLRFHRHAASVRALVAQRISLTQARTRKLFAIGEARATRLAREIPPGTKPTLAVRPLWFGSEFAGRSALTAVEYAGKPASPGAGARGEARMYTIMYERPDAGGASSALPGQLPPVGEIQVASQPLSLPLSQAALEAFNGVNGDERYDPWPHQQVQLVNGERATVVPNLSEGIQRDNGNDSVWQFAVITSTTLTWVSGGFNIADIATIAAALRPVGE